MAPPFATTQFTAQGLPLSSDTASCNLRSGRNLSMAYMGSKHKFDLSIWMLNLTKRTFSQNVKLNAPFKKKNFFKEVCRHKSLKSHFYGRKIEFPQIVSTNWVSTNSFYIESLTFASITMYSSKCYFIFTAMATFSRFECYVKLGSAGGIWGPWPVLKQPLFYRKALHSPVSEPHRHADPPQLCYDEAESWKLETKTKPPQLFTSGYGFSVVKICSVDCTGKENVHRQF